MSLEPVLISSVTNRLTFLLVLYNASSRRQQHFDPLYESIRKFKIWKNLAKVTSRSWNGAWLDLWFLAGEVRQLELSCSPLVSLELEEFGVELTLLGLPLLLKQSENTVFFLKSESLDMHLF